MLAEQDLAFYDRERETRLPNSLAEPRDAREQLTTTAEILEVIRNSLNDTQPVFDAIVQSGARLFPGVGGQHRTSSSAR